ncbi:TetR/AcrR family transcriptional regulator [Nonomuraea jiangxiensis]|uniref:DNA-binding transcriptional regulator, AcrR family n=1 Tax=Nonomuraea jiangxiensis TaxID=633440 RepID=A0A1G9ANA7_9ACTN|nr:TetR family transcriptional regulator [Nonomuraea jiangxiensis]SDK28757.1 DNA-binding transcriptional regulator, AcrR family [Nonomuraea jiangxiensis]
MVRLTRAETQERNRAKVLAAARQEFAERGFRDAKIDDIADRAELTRGAVYSNFPGKRALYFAVLADLAERAPVTEPAEPALTVREALSAVARAWVTRLPLVTDDEHGPTRLGMYLMPEILADEVTRRPFAELMKLNAILLGLAIERLRPPREPDGRLVRLAEAVLTVLQGAGQLSAAAPGFVEPFNVIRVCEQLADLDLGDRWAVAPMLPEVRRADEPWAPPPAPDALTGEPARLADDGVVAVLGVHRLSAAEEAVRAAPPGAEVTAVVVTSAPQELLPLARLAIAELSSCLRQSFPRPAWPRLRVVYDESGEVAAAAGVAEPGDGTETAIRIESGRITLRAHGFGACHAAATTHHP